MSDIVSSMAIAAAKKMAGPAVGAVIHSFIGTAIDIAMKIAPGAFGLDEKSIDEELKEWYKNEKREGEWLNKHGEEWQKKYGDTAINEMKDRLIERRDEYQINGQGKYWLEHHGKDWGLYEEYTAKKEVKVSFNEALNPTEVNIQHSTSTNSLREESSYSPTSSREYSSSISTAANSTPRSELSYSSKLRSKSVSSVEGNNNPHAEHLNLQRRKSTTATSSLYQ